MSGQLVVKRRGYYTVEAELTVTDVDGTVHKAIGEAANYHSWLPYALCLTPTHMMRWTSKGRTGFGTIMEGVAARQMCRSRALASRVPANHAQARRQDGIDHGRQQRHRPDTGPSIRRRRRANLHDRYQAPGARGDGGVSQTGCPGAHRGRRR